SLKVVSMAVVCVACNKRSATLARRRVMGTRCSVLGPCGTAASGAGAAAAAAAAGLVSAGALAPPIKLITSSLVMRTSLPVLGTELGSSLFSSISLRAAGLISTSTLLLSASAVLAASAFAGAAAGSGAAALAPSSISASTSLLTMVAPSVL